MAGGATASAAERLHLSHVALRIDPGLADARGASLQHRRLGSAADRRGRAGLSADARNGRAAVRPLARFADWCVRSPAIGRRTALFREAGFLAYDRAALVSPSFSGSALGVPLPRAGRGGGLAAAHARPSDAA